jgi:hypothetical protein
VLHDWRVRGYFQVSGGSGRNTGLFKHVQRDCRGFEQGLCRYLKAVANAGAAVKAARVKQFETPGMEI